MQKRLLSLLPLFFFLFINLKVVFAEEIDLPNLPTQLGEMLGIGTFPAQILVSALSCVMLILPLGLLKIKAFFMIVILVLWLAFLVSVGWLEVWLLILETLVITVLFGSKIKDWSS